MNMIRMRLHFLLMVSVQASAILVPLQFLTQFEKYIRSSFISISLNLLTSKMPMLKFLSKKTSLSPSFAVRAMPALLQIIVPSNSLIAMAKEQVIR